ncbi:type I methionyl aminopeptidase [bacterium]|nr:type I methionyl aminopeptidase [bacterium]
MIIKSEAEIEGIRESGRILAAALKVAELELAPGKTTAEIDVVIEEYILSNGAKPVFKGYRGFPAASCISINEEVIHGIPGNRELKDGDLVKIDVGVSKNGFISDSSRSFAVGRTSDKIRKLVSVTRDTLDKAIDASRAGNRVGDISHTIEENARAAGFEVVKEYFGHGTGLSLHEEPNIPNYGPKGVGPLLEPGMTLAIEPMLNMGTGKIKLKEDNWTVVTADGKISAHFEHTIAITRKGPEVLTAYV